MNYNYNRILLIVLFIFSFVIFNCNNLFAQVSRVWEYSYNPANNLEASGNCITVLPSGKSVTGGVYKSINGSMTKNTLILNDESGVLIDADTNTNGFGFVKVIYDGSSNIIAAGTLIHDSLPLSKIIVARFDTSFTVKNYLIPDTTLASPTYQVLDMALLSNGNIVVASNWDAFPLRCLSLLCMDTTGNVLWERIDSVFQFSYDVKLLEDKSGGIFVAGSGNDTSTASDFIFVSHFTSGGNRDWSFRYYSPAQIFADMTDMIRDIDDHLYISGNVMDTSGQVGCLIKTDSAGNIFWNKQIVPLAYSRIVSDLSGNVYGAAVPLNGIDVFTIDKIDSSGTRIDSSAFQLSGYFASELGDLKFLSNGMIVATGGLFVWSFPKSDLFLTAFDTSLNFLGYDIFDSLNLLGEKGIALAEGNDEIVYSCGRINYENQFETSNIGLVKYDLSGVINNVIPVENSGFEIYPNPSVGELTFKFQGEINGRLLIRIVNNTGNEVLRKEITGNNNYTDRFNLPPGFYIVIAETANGSAVRKLIVTVN